MGYNEGTRIWKRGAEKIVSDAETRDMNVSDFVEKSRIQAENFVKQNSTKASVFISAGHRDMILNAKDQMGAAKSVVRNEPHFIPDTIEDLDHQASFLIALAEELNKPHYNQ